MEAQKEAPKNETNNVRLVVETLLAGFSWKPAEISALLNENTGKKIDSRYVSRVLSRISDIKQSDLGYFMIRKKEGKSFVYSVVNEARFLPAEIAYRLTIRTNGKAFTLEQVIEKFPQLSHYIKNKPTTKPDRQSGRKTDSGKSVDQNSKRSQKPLERAGPAIIDLPADKINKANYCPARRELIIKPVTAMVPVLNPGIPVIEERIPSYDGTMIHYMSIGKGDLTIVACNGIGVSTFFWKFIANYFANHCRIILWDYRSHGRSDPAPNLHELTMINNAKDLKAILDYNGVEKPILIGHSMGVQVIFEFYRLYPDNVSGLIPLLGSYGNPLSTFLNTDKMIYVINAMYLLSFAFPQIINPLLKNLIFNPLSFLIAKATKLVNWQHCTYQELKPYLQHLSSVDPRALFSMAVRMQDHSARDVLPDIKVPTLIIAGEDDRFTPLRISNEMYRIIPSAEMMIIPRGSHAAIIEQPELINLRVEKFINDKLGGFKEKSDG